MKVDPLGLGMLSFFCFMLGLCVGIWVTRKRP